MACCLQQKHVMIVLAHCGFGLVYAMRVNLSIVIVAMVNATYAHVEPSLDPECISVHENITEPITEGEYNWNQATQGVVLSAFFYGYLVLSITGGWLAHRYSCKILVGLAVLNTAIWNLLTPAAAKASVYCLVIVRVMEGIVEGMMFPAMHCMLSNWSPKEDISRNVVYVYSGMQTGMAISMPLSGFIIDNDGLGGWPTTFYIYGVTGIIWFVFWFYLVDENPSTTNTLHRPVKENKTHLKVPWLKIFKSLPVWAIIMGHFADHWAWYLVLTDLPTYFREVLGFQIKKNGLMTALPYIASFIMYLVAGNMADYLRRHCMSTVNARRLISIVAFYPTTIFFILISYTKCNEKDLSVVFVLFIVTFVNINYGGFIVNHLDISPNFCGILMGISNFFGTVAGCIAPLVTGYYTNNDPTRLQYRKVFLIAAAICTVGGTFCVFFINGDVQAWNEGDENDVDNNAVDNNDDDSYSLHHRRTFWEENERTPLIA